MRKPPPPPHTAFLGLSLDLFMHGKRKGVIAGPLGHCPKGSNPHWQSCGAAANWKLATGGYAPEPKAAGNWQPTTALRALPERKANVRGKRNVL